MTSDQRSISAVIFDMDGLMLDTERVNLWAWQQAMADQGLAAPAELYLSTVGLTDEDTDAVLLSALGDQALVQVIRASERRHMAAFLADKGIPLKPGLLELLELLDDLSLPRAVASSRERASVQAWLQAAGLRERLDAIVGGDEVPRGKPAPDIFLVAASHLGVPANQCLVLEDSEAGVQAARTAGMTPILVPDLKAPTTAAQGLAHRVMPSLHEVRDYVRELGGHHRGPGDGNEESRDR